MLINISMDLLNDVPELHIGTVLNFQREGSQLLYRNQPISVLPAVMQRPAYDGIVTEIQPLHAVVSIARFADLHRHSDNSLLDGICKVKDMVKRSVPQGALTDHGVLYGFLEFYKEMRKAGKKPIIGCEVYVENLSHELSRDHLILLAENNEGYHTLLKLVSNSYAHMKGGRPHILLHELRESHNGLIATSACIAGTIAKHIRAGEMEQAETALQTYLDIFGASNFYLEIQRHGIPDEKTVEMVYRRWAKEKGLKVIAATDSHYASRDDKQAHEIALCMQTGKTLLQDHMKFEGTGYHIHTSEEMEELFGDYPEALENTLELAERCQVQIHLGDVNLPRFDIPEPYRTPEEFFSFLCESGFKKRFSGTEKLHDPRYKERYDYEMEMIKKMGFVSYFLIVWDFINFARSHNIYVGPGRGSAAGSLLAYCIGMTDLDPIELNLLFERFLNPERVSWPDVDTDFEHTGREAVIDYIRQKYGADRVCRIITFGTEAARMVIKDVGRVLGYSPAFCGALAKKVPAEPHMTIQKALEDNPDLKNDYENRHDVKKILDFAMKLEGCKRHASQHACFDAETLITTKDGLKRIADVQIGDEVLTHKGRYKPVVKTMITETDEVHKLKFYGAPPVEVTGNHPLLVRKMTPVHVRNENGSRTYIRTFSECSWRSVGCIEPGDWIGMPINKMQKLPVNSEGLPFDNKSFWWIIGRYLGDGWTEIYNRTHTTERRIIICCGYPKDVQDITQKLNEIGYRYRVEKARTTFKIFIEAGNIALYDYLQTLGEYAYGKHLNPDILELPVTYASSLLDGYLSADGYFFKEQNRYFVKSVSKPLIMGIAQLVNKVYHTGTTYSVKSAHIDVIEGRTVYAKEQYEISFLAAPKKKMKSFYEDGYVWVRVKKHEITNEHREMYNLTVLDDSSYVANGIAAHNCGLVIAPDTVSSYLPTALVKDEETGNMDMTSQVIMTEVEELSLLKMDLLGLKNMTVIHESIDAINRKYGTDLDYHDIPLNDRATLKFLSEGHTGGVFQLESPGMTKVVTRMLADIDTLSDEELHQGFERLIAAVALYRPGPMAYIDDYIAGMQNPDDIHYDCPEVQSILQPTYGQIIYQEQVMQIVQKLAGYTLGRADIVRKAMGKKKIDLMEKERKVFIYGNQAAFESGKDANYAPGCIANGIPEQTAEIIWGKMADFAKYAFNRSHAACYAYIAMITAWLSCHYPEEFYAAMLNAFCSSGDKFKNYLCQASRRGLRILPPDVNASHENFFVETDGIRYGLKGLKGMDKYAGKIVNERSRNGAFLSFQDFYKRMRVEKKAFEALLYAGAFDGFHETRRSLFTAFPKFVANAAQESKVIEGQMNLFDGAVNPDDAKYSQIDIEQYPEFDGKMLMQMEHETLGFYLSSHPADAYEKLCRREPRFYSITKLCEDEPFGRVTTVGLIQNLRTIFTRTEEIMYLFTLENRYHTIPCVVFPKEVQANQQALQEGNVVKIHGLFQENDRGKQIVVNTMIHGDAIQASDSQTVIVQIENKAQQIQLLQWAENNKGSFELVILAPDKNNPEQLRQYNTNKKITKDIVSMDYLTRNFISVSIK